jgi:uncharacterized protein with HEPN domain
LSSRSPYQRIQDILTAITSIQQRTANLSFDEFQQQETIAKAVLYDLIIIGEAATNVPAEIRQKTPNIPWRAMSDMRNVMAHEYFQVNLKITWSTITNNLPTVVQPLNELLTDLETV